MGHYDNCREGYCAVCGQAAVRETAFCQQHLKTDTISQTDEDLVESITKLTKELHRRDKARKDAEMDVRVQRNSIIRSQMTRALVDALAPEHSYRYNECTDTNLDGIDRRSLDAKEYECSRCELLYFREDSILEDLKTVEVTVSITHLKE